MGATIQTVRKHEMQIAAILEGIKQLMDGQAALGEAVEALKSEGAVLRREIEAFKSWSLTQHANG